MIMPTPNAVASDAENLGRPETMTSATTAATSNVGNNAKETVWNHGANVVGLRVSNPIPGNIGTWTRRAAISDPTRAHTRRPSIVSRESLTRDIVEVNVIRRLGWGRFRIRSKIGLLPD